MTKADKQEIKEIFHDHLSGIIAQTDANFEIIGYKLEEIIKQTTKTNGRVLTLESETTVWRYLTNKPYRLAASILVVVILSRLVTNDDILNWVLKIFT